MTKYNYGYVELQDIMENIDEFIIPECQEACRLFWDKNIETFMVSNREDSELYVFVCNLSDENIEIMKNNMSSNPENYFFSNYRNCYGIRTNGVTSEDAKKLSSLTNVFKEQDTKRFVTSESFLEEYKRTDGEYGVNTETYEVYRKVNPLLANATLEEALEKTNKKDLYVEDEDRVYENEFFLKWHDRYKKSQEMKKMLYQEVKSIEDDEKRMQ